MITPDQFPGIMVSGRCTAPRTDHVQPIRRSPQVSAPKTGISGEDSSESNVLMALR
jgi:hypothetical protein